jgi:BolA family transcriptional regulator, general stress-responsive regulator
MQIQRLIQDRLVAAFAASDLVVTNESHKHHGHAGDDGSGESHFHVRLRAPELGPLSRIERHRAVHRALGADLTARIHALALDLDG